MLAQGKDVLKYIPQRPPFVFIDKIIMAEETAFVSGYTVKDENPLVYNGELLESGLIENIAQTAAAGVGYYCITNNKPVVPGFIGSVKKLSVNKLPKTGGELITKVEVVSQIMNATIINGFIKMNNEVIAECSMNIFLQE